MKNTVFSFRQIKNRVKKNVWSKSTAKLYTELCFADIAKIEQQRIEGVLARRKSKYEERIARAN